MSYDNLLESIADTVGDYRQGEIAPITPDHVNTWVMQFDKNDRPIILKEMDNILETYYVTKSDLIKFLSELLINEKLFGDEPIKIIKKTKFLDIQRKGSSQKDLLLLMDDILQRNYGISLNECGNTSQSMYIYLDECLFSGNTAYWDIANWIVNKEKAINLKLVFCAMHSAGEYYVKKRLQKNFSKLDLEIWRAYTFSNNRWSTTEYECMWPIEFHGDELVDQYIQQLNYIAQGNNLPPLFRSTRIPKNESVFSSLKNRMIVEHAFLKAGAYICSLPRVAKEEMRPLGYEYLKSLGFGGVFITYRNISNNCPLALWWGDPDYPNSHPFSQWYPLFLRKGNS